MLGFLALTAASIWWPQPVHAGRNDIGGVECSTIFDGKVLLPSSTVTSTAFTQLGRSQFQSVQYRVRGGQAVSIFLLTSLDETNYALPDAGANVTTSGAKDADWHGYAISIPLCKALKVRVDNLNATTNATVDVILCSQ